MLKFFRWAYTQSVFAPIERELIGVRILIALFHRSTATLYLMYSIWGLITTWVGIPSLTQMQGEVWQTVFSAAVFLCCAPACFGATFFPRTARLEMYAGSGFVGLIAFYVGTIAVLAVATADFSKIGGAVLVATILVIPLARTTFIYRTLIKQSVAVSDRLAAMEKE